MNQLIQKTTNHSSHLSGVVSPLPHPFKAVVLAIGSAAGFGASIVMTKGLLPHFNPLVLLSIQSASSVIFLWGIILLQGIRIPLKWSTLAAGATGLLEPGLAYFFGILGLFLTTASNASLIHTIEPILTIALAGFILREPISRSLIGLAGLACVGIGVITFPDLFVRGESSLLGDFLVFLGVFCAAFYAIVSRRFVAEFHPLGLVTLQQSFALVLFLVVLAIFTISGGTIEWTTVNYQIVVFAVASGILGYALAFWLYLMALKQQLVSVTSMYLTLIPVFGVIAAYFFLGERLLPIQGIGGALILMVVLKISKLSEQGVH